MLSYRCNSLKPEHEKCRGDVYDSDEVKWVGCTCECHLPNAEELLGEFNPNDIQEPQWADDSPKLEELVDRLEQALNRIEAIVDRLPPEVRGL